MESELSPGEAAEHLRRHDGVLGRARTAAHVMFWGALLGALTMTAVLLVLPREGFVVALLVPPVLAFQQLTDGLRERWGTRRRTTLLEGAFMAAAVVGFVVLGWSDAGYPWWLAGAVGLLFFVGAGLLPLVRSRRDGSSAEPGPRARRPLSRQVTVTTAAIGVVGALCVACTTQAWFAVPGLAALGLLAASGLSRGSPWSLRQAGYEWRTLQWCAFGLAAFVAIGVPLLVATTDSFAPAGLWVASGVIAAAMALAALWPSRAR